MRRFLLCLLVLLWVAQPLVHTDTYVEHKPGKDDLTRRQAIQLALDFFTQLTAAPSSDLPKASDFTATFGTGTQWDADTDEDCWVIAPRSHEAAIVPIAVIHGRSAEVLFWEYRQRRPEGDLTCLLFQPSAENISEEAADTIALARYAEAYEALVDVTHLHHGHAYGSACHLVDASFPRDQQIWNIQLTYYVPCAPGETEGLFSEIYTGFYVIDAFSGEILQERYTHMGEDGREIESIEILTGRDNVIFNSKMY